VGIHFDFRGLQLVSEPTHQQILEEACQLFRAGAKGQTLFEHYR
jgi:hypothetical protein